MKAFSSQLILFSCQFILLFAMALLIAFATFTGLGRFVYNQYSTLFSYEAQASDESISISNKRRRHEPLPTNLDKRRFLTTRSASGNSRSATSTSRSASSNSRSVTDKSRSVNDNSRSISDNSRSILKTSRSITGTSRSGNDNSRSIADTSRPTADISRSMSGTYRSASDDSRYISDDSRYISGNSRSISGDSHPIDNTSRSISNGSQPVLDNSASRLSTPDNGGQELHWLDKQAFADLIRQYSEFAALLEFIWKSSMTSTQPALVDGCLYPIRMHLLVDPEQLQLYNRGLLFPLNATFEEFCIRCIAFLDKVYCIDRIMDLREQWPTAPSFMNEKPTPQDLEMLNRIRDFFSFPDLPEILSNVLAACGFDNIDVPADFMNRIVLDLGAIIHRRTVPSYVASAEYRERLKVLFSVIDDKCPGSFPEITHEATPEVTPEVAPENEADVWLEIADESDPEKSSFEFNPPSLDSSFSFNPSTCSLSGLPTQRPGKRVSFDESLNKTYDKIDELMSMPSLSSLKISEESEIELRNLRKEAEALRAHDVEQEKLRKLRERTANGPQQPVVAPLSDEWIEKASNTVFAPDTEVLATTCQGTPLRKHDFVTVVAAKTWLNDEIVNGALGGLEKEINLVNGITDYKQQGRKCLVMNSFFWPRVEKANGRQTQSILRRMGVTPKNFLLMDTVLIPICKDYHWTLMVLQPQKRKVMHLDSFNKRSSHPDMALAWISDYLGDLYTAQEWEVMVVKSPQQNNGYDCGVHVITNGICMALGLDPVASYCVEEMPLQRLRIAGMLLNGGLNGEFDLWKH
ncbi:uncharacterized protein TrAFT101_010156 [Trichoderma asperellum]|nr:hypothetical protein TrAFT101_010156 [Trichoderma asperellum]